MPTREELVAAGVAIQRGLLTPEQLASACETAQQHNRSLAETIVGSGLLSAEDWGRIAAEVPPSQTEEAPVREVKSSVDRTLDALDGIAAECESDGTGADESSHGRYVRLNLVGSGGVAEIWRASDDHLGREVALKQPRPDRPEGADTLAVEVDVLCRLRHPNIVPLYDLVTRPGDPGILFYTMPLLLGPTLREAAASFHSARPHGRHVRFGLLPLLTAFQSVCRAVTHSHDQGILHLDLKGDNVKLGDLGEAVVLDWGLARGVGARIERITGTPAYLAPEQAEPGHSTDPRTDVYGLGAILYELFTGSPPFAGTETPEILGRVKTTPPTPPRVIWPEVPRPLEAICLKALAKRPEGRYPSAEALRADLDRWLIDELVTAYPERAGERFARWARHHGRAVIRVAVAVAVAVAGLVFGLVQVEQKRASTAEQRQVTVDALAAERESLGVAIRAGNDCFGFADDRLGDLDGTDPIRVQLLERYLKYYQGLLSRYQDDPDIQLEVAAARVRVGWIQVQIGRYADSLAIAEVVVPLLDELCKRPDPSDRLWRLRIDAYTLSARSLHSLGGRDEGLARLTRAEVLAAEYAAQTVAGPERDRLLASVAVTRGALDPDPRAAEAAHRTAADLFARAARTSEDPTGNLTSRALAYVSMAIQQRDQGRADDALASLAEARRQCEEVGARSGWPYQLRRRMAAGVNMEGVLHCDRGRFTTAAEMFVRAVDFRRGLVQRNPSNLSLRMELATSLANLGKALRLAGRTVEATSPAREAAEIGEEILRESPGSVHFRNFAGIFRTRAGWAECANGRWTDAVGQFRRAGEVLAPLLVSPQADPAHLRQAAEAAFGLGLALARQGQWRDAWAAWRAGAGNVRRLPPTPRPTGSGRPGNG